MKLDVVLEPQDEGFTVSVPSLPACISEGATKEEALKNIREAIAVYLKREPDDLKDYPPGSIFETVEL